MSADLRFTKRTDSSVFLLFWSATLPVRWMELRLLSQNRPHARKWVRFENARSKSRVSRSHTNREPKTTIFWRLHNFVAILTAYIFGVKHDIDNRASALIWGIHVALDKPVNVLLWNFVCKIASPVNALKTSQQHQCRLSWRDEKCVDSCLQSTSVLLEEEGRNT